MRSRWNNIHKAYIFSFFWMFLVLIPVMVPFFLSQGLSMQQVFLLQSIFGLTIAVCELPTGYLCDHWGRKNTMLIGALLAALACTWLIFAHGFWELVIFEVLNAVGSALVSGADISFLYDSLENPREHRSRATHAIANMQLAHVSAESIASLLGGILVAYSFNAVVLAHALAAWIPFAVALSFTEPRYEKMKGKNHRENFLRVLKHVLASDRLLTLIFINLVVWGLSSFIAVWIFQKYWQDRNVPLAWFGAIWAAYNITVGLVGKQVHSLENRFGPLPLLFFLALAPVTAYFVMASSAGWLGVLAGFLFYAGRGVTQVLLKDAFNWRLPSEFRATANSLQTFLFRGTFAILGPGIGYSIDHWGMTHTLTILGGAFAGLFFLLALPLIHAVRKAAPRHIPVVS